MKVNRFNRKQKRKIKLKKKLKKKLRKKAKNEVKVIKINYEGCRRPIVDSWWNYCGETDMGQTAPVLCKECDPIEGLELKVIK